MPVTLHVPLLNGPFWDSVALTLGHAALLILFILLIFQITIVALFALSIRKKHLYCSRLLRPTYLLLKRAVQVGYLMLEIDDTKITKILIQLENDVNRDEFAMIPLEKRIVFLPHCLRSTNCQANLTPFGIKCLECGKCDLGMATSALMDAGYPVFIIPGSAYIKHLLKQSHLKAMIGVGCHIEIKQFQELARRNDVTAMIIETKSDDCVETTVVWEDVFEIASIGLDKKIGEYHK
ncbi:MAG: DUF116 domain-containing protein [Methanocalculaceae archaeon]|jgi:hypothetical protein|nr:DUF116 domain-containing protein [Methanocalculaceae archaeon]